MIYFKEKKILFYADVAYVGYQIKKTRHFDTSKNLYVVAIICFASIIILLNGKKEQFLKTHISRI